jgi:hypothetical protein
MGYTTKLLVAPQYLPTTWTSLYAPFATYGRHAGALIKHIHVCNDTGSNANFSLSLSGDDSQALFFNQVVYPYNTFDYYCLTLISPDMFGVSGHALYGVCPTGASNLTIMVEGEIGYAV